MKNSATAQGNIHFPKVSVLHNKDLFLARIMSALAFRLILIADHYNPLLGKAMFYLEYWDTWSFLHTDIEFPREG
jgi:hypothetical protein